MQILKTFNYDELLIKEYKHWYLLLRSNQTTIGSMVLIEKNFHTKFSDISSESFAEFGKIIKEIELTLKTLFRYDKINYLMLMMRDKEVHFHVIPRYSKEVTYKSITFHDLGWPGQPNLTYSNEINKKLKIELKTLIQNKMPK